MDKNPNAPERPPVPPAPADRAAEAPAVTGPHAPGPVGGTTENAPESGGYSGEVSPRQPDNRKGGFGAG